MSAMAEEVRFFLRTTVYSAGISVVYWFLTSDPFGTVILAFTAFAGAFFVGMVIGHAPATLRGFRAPPAPRDREPSEASKSDERQDTRFGEGVDPRPRPTFLPGRIFGGLNRTFGLAEDRDITRSDPLAGGPERLPTASIWPAVGGAAALLVGMGLVYGSWLLLPGIAVGVLAAIGWIGQETRRT